MRCTTARRRHTFTTLLMKLPRPVLMEDQLHPWALRDTMSRSGGNTLRITLIAEEVRNWLHLSVVTKGIVHRPLYRWLQQSRPIRFLSVWPMSPSQTQGDIYRIITISRLPADITLSSILHRVRSGAILQSQLLNTLAITCSITTRIIFLHECCAFAYEEHAQKHLIISNSLSIDETLLPVPT